MAGRFEIFKDRAGEYRFRLLASNGQIILASEGYSTKNACLNGIAAVKKYALNDENFERKQTSSGGFMFNLKAMNGQVIGLSERYESPVSRDNGLASVQRNALEASLLDLQN